MDYRVSYKVAGSSDEYTIFDENFVPKQAEVYGLTPGTTYEFVVQARNVVAYRDGYSLYSAAINVEAI